MTALQLDRFMQKVSIVPGSCWWWLGTRNTDGYGYTHRSRSAGGSPLAHKEFYEHHNGKVPYPLELDHLCRNRACVNPKHLEVVTGKENKARGEGPSAINTKKAHCPQGHDLAGENLVKHMLLKGERHCKKCANAHSLRNYYAREKELRRDRTRH